MKLQLKASNLNKSIKNDVPVYPITTADSVICSDGKTLQQKMTGESGDSATEYIPGDVEVNIPTKTMYYAELEEGSSTISGEYYVITDAPYTKIKITLNEFYDALKEEVTLEDMNMSVRIQMSLDGETTVFNYSAYDSSLGIFKFLGYNGITIWELQLQKYGTSLIWNKRLVYNIDDLYVNPTKASIIAMKQLQNMPSSYASLEGNIYGDFMQIVGFPNNSIDFFGDAYVNAVSNQKMDVLNGVLNMPLVIIGVYSNQPVLICVCRAAALDVSNNIYYHCSVLPNHTIKMKMSIGGPGDGDAEGKFMGCVLNIAPNQ